MTRLSHNPLLMNLKTLRARAGQPCRLVDHQTVVRLLKAIARRCQGVRTLNTTMTLNGIA